MMLERGVGVDHTTIFRWIQAYAPELDKRCRAHLNPTNDSWRVDETYIKRLGTVSVIVSSGGFKRLTMNLCKSQATFIVIVVYRNQQVGCLKVAQIYIGSPLGYLQRRSLPT